MAGRILGIIFLLGMLALPLGSAQADSVGSGYGVSLYQDPNASPPLPGSTIQKHLKIDNGDSGVTEFQIVLGTVDPGPNGQAKITNDPDPVWQQNVHFSATDLNIPANQSADVYLTINIPKSLAPNDYFVGVLVVPVGQTGPGITEIREIGYPIDLNVAGPRTTSATLKFDLPFFHIFNWTLPVIITTSGISGDLDITCNGPAAIHGEGDILVTKSGQDTAVYYSRLPADVVVAAGTYKTFDFSWKTGFEIDQYKTAVNFDYHPDVDKLSSYQATSTFWVIHPGVFVILAVVLLLIGGIIFLWLKQCAQSKKLKELSAIHAKKTI